MVDPHNVVHIERRGQPFHPPFVSGLRQIIPVVERIAPELALGSVAVGRAARDLDRRPVGVQHEHLVVGPRVGAVLGDVDRYVADYFYALLVGV